MLAHFNFMVIRIYFLPFFFASLKQIKHEKSIYTTCANLECIYREYVMYSAMVVVRNLFYEHVKMCPSLYFVSAHTFVEWKNGMMQKNISKW